ANTVVSSRSTREPMIANSSAGVNGWVIGAGAARPAWTEGGLIQMRVARIARSSRRVAPIARSLRQLSGLLLLLRQALAAEQLEVVVPRRRAPGATTEARDRKSTRPN